MSLPLWSFVRSCVIYSFNTMLLVEIGNRRLIFHLDNRPSISDFASHTADGDYSYCSKCEASEKQSSTTSEEIKLSCAHI